MVRFTVAIPTYNGENRLPQLLERLLLCGTHTSVQQPNFPPFTWEVIIVDNNSTDRTKQVVLDYQAKWLADCQLRYYFESKLGAAFARQKAVEEAKAQLIGFLDDDNLPASDWIAQAITFAQAHPEAGAFGSQIHGKFAIEPPFDIKKLACFLAIIERGNQAFCYQPSRRILPPAAGLVVRRQAWLDSVPPRLVLNYKGREAGLASEDLEAVLHIQQAGWEIWYNPEMQVDHYIPPERLQKDYLLSVVRCVGLSRHHLRMMRLKPWQRILAFPLYFFNDLRQLVLHQIRYGYCLNGDIVLACEREFLKSSTISFLFLGREKLKS